MTENQPNQLSKLLIVGIEGGASFSKGILIDGNSIVLASVEDAPSTNFWVTGIDVAYERIYNIINELKIKAKLPEHTMIDVLGCCLSGVKDNETKQPFAEGFLKKYPNIVKKCVSRNDTIGSIFTVSKEGGLVLIAGTGSNCFLLNPDGTSKNCGGWGHLIGDQGSAFKLVHRAIKFIINEEDGYKKTNFNMENVKKQILDHFQIKEMIEILKYCYQDFDKLSFASICIKIANQANEGDKFAKHLFYLNGRDQARHINAVLPFIDKKLLNEKGGLKIVCIGSIFKSWHLLQQGFIDTLNKDLKEFRLVNLICSSSIGAAFIAAKSIDHILNIHSDENMKTFFTYKNN